jgi:hypothetical protein
VAVAGAAVAVGAAGVAVEGVAAVAGASAANMFAEANKETRNRKGDFFMGLTEIESISSTAAKQNMEGGRAPENENSRRIAEARGTRIFTEANDENEARTLLSLLASVKSFFGFSQFIFKV